MYTSCLMTIVLEAEYFWLTIKCNKFPRNAQNNVNLAGNILNKILNIKLIIIHKKNVKNSAYVSCCKLDIRISFFKSFFTSILVSYQSITKEMQNMQVTLRFAYNLNWVSHFRTNYTILAECLPTKNTHLSIC